MAAVWTESLWWNLTWLFMSSFWIFCGIYAFFDTLPMLRKYKVQPEKGTLYEAWKRAMPDALVNTLLIVPLVNSLFGDFLEEQVTKTTSFSWKWEILKIFGFILLNDIQFYSLHRLLHTYPVLYKMFHKRHHRYTAPVAPAAAFGHPIDYGLVNNSCIIVPIMILCPHVYTARFIILMTSFFNVNSHSGYVFVPDVLDATSHDLHHSNITKNYGVLCLVDWLMGSYQAKPNEVKAAAQ
eukprot:GILJ01001584.1.p1 GENE.GILJ01001584.1~~GILJ01001584.1.p1  ORF type:complete len:238 (+),score=24.13 GILJ01001584.1:52-765(+)